MNNVFLVGRVTKDIELRYTNSEMATVKFTVAVDRIKKGESDFISCVAFGKTAELLGKYVAKGCRVAINGSIRTGSYEKDDGTRVYTTDVAVNNLDIIDFKDSGKGYKEEKKEPPKYEFIECEQEDLPF